jgi:hypothetical protein
MSAENRFHEVANDALESISSHLKPGAKLALVIYTPGEPERDIVLKDTGLNVDEVLSTLRRRGGLGLDGENAYKQDLCDSIVGAMALGKQNTNPPPAGHWCQEFWDIGRAEGAQKEELIAALGKVTADLFYQIEAKHGPKAAAEYPSIAEAKALIAQACA